MLCSNLRIGKLDFGKKPIAFRISGRQSKIVLGRMGQGGGVWTIWTAIDSSHVENVLNIP